MARNILNRTDQLQFQSTTAASLVSQTSTATWSLDAAILWDEHFMKTSVPHSAAPYEKSRKTSSLPTNSMCSRLTSNYQKKSCRMTVLQSTAATLQPPNASESRLTGNLDLLRDACAAL